MGNLKKYSNVQAYLNEMFGEQFVFFVSDVGNPQIDASKKVRFKRNQEILKHSNFEFPDYNKYHYHVREIFELYKSKVHKDDLIEFAKGSYYNENIINVYMKMLEKMHLVIQSSFNFQRATRNSQDLYNSSFSTNMPQKIMYFNSNFARKLNNQNQLKDCLTQLQNFYKYDTVLLPFFINEVNDQRCLIVSIKVANCQVDLYDREREIDNHDISDTVLHMMDLAAKIQDIDFNEEQIDGGVEGICVEKEEDMIIASCYIAECITFNRPVELDLFNVEQQRQRILDAFIQLLEFK